MNLQNKRIAIVADWLIDFGWAEVVISHFLEMYPQADIYTSVCFMKHPMLEGRKVYTSWLQKIPFLNKKHKLAGILRPWAFREFDLSGYNLVICSSSAESKQVALGKWREKSHAKVIVYCHTPIRYYWSHAKEYEDMMEFGFLNPLVKSVFRLVKWWMKKVDYRAAQKVDFFIANSETTRERIQKYYNRDAEVIYPGIDTPVLSSWGTKDLLREEKEKGKRADSSFDSEWQEQIQSPNSNWIASRARNDRNWGDYYFSIGRCIPYKKFDLLVDGFNTNGKKLILATGTDNLLYRTLREKSKPNIEWRFYPTNAEKTELMKQAKAFLFASEEDFGIVPVEAMMAGTPVIAYGKWGATESVADGETGIFFSPQTAEALSEAVEKFEKMDFDREKIQKHAEKFSKERFQENIQKFIESHD